VGVPGAGGHQAGRVDVVLDRDAAGDQVDDGDALFGWVPVGRVGDPPAADQAVATGRVGGRDAGASDQDAACCDASGGADELPTVECALRHGKPSYVDGGVGGGA
jgi:hypothetical protein